MKYIILEVKQGEEERLVPILFPNALEHLNVFNAIARMIVATEDRDARAAGRADLPTNVSPASAGHVTVDGVTCNGLAVDLNVYSDVGDAGLILGEK